MPSTISALSTWDSKSTSAEFLSNIQGQTKIAYHREIFPYLLEMSKHWHCSKCLSTAYGNSAINVPVAHVFFNESDLIIA